MEVQDTTSKPTYTETEERIFLAALKVFAQKGKDGARMQEIADAAGINKAMLHYYFRSKENLYESVFEYVFHRWMLQLSDAIRDATTFEECLRRLIDSYMDKHVEQPEIMKLMVHENLAGAPAIRARVQQMGPTFQDRVPFRVFADRMQEAIDAGEIRDVDPFHTFFTLIGATVFFFLAFPTLSIVHPALAADRAATIEARKAHLFDLVYYGLKRTD